MQRICTLKPNKTKPPCHFSRSSQLPLLVNRRKNRATHPVTSFEFGVKSSSSMSELFFNDFFKVEGVDPDGKKYDKGSEKHNMHMLLDVNTEIYPINRKERFLMALSPSLVLDTKDGPVSIQEKFEYIMYGRLYDIKADGSCSPPEVEVYASFGGLQLMLRGDPSHCVKFAVDQKLFLLIRKLES